MSEPHYGYRDAFGLDAMMSEGGEGWDFFKKLGENAGPQAGGLPECKPEDQVAKNLAKFCRNAHGRAVVEWLMDITLRQPRRITGRTLEETALLSATRQGIDGVGEAILAAIAHGEKLIEEEIARASEQRSK